MVNKPAFRGICALALGLAFAYPSSLLAKPNASAQHRASRPTPDSRRINLGAVNGVNVSLVRGISVNGEAYYIVNIVDQSDSVNEAKHGILNVVFNNGQDTDDNNRYLDARGYRVSLLNTPEIVSLRRSFSHQDPYGWDINGRNIASATLLMSGSHHNVSFSNDDIFNDGGGVYGGVALVKVVSAPPQYILPAPARIAHQQSVQMPQSNVANPTSARRPVAYNGQSELVCGENVDCENLNEIVAKMRKRWMASSSSTPYSIKCLEAIDRMSKFTVQWQVWSADQHRGIGQGQMNICNIH